MPPQILAVYLQESSSVASASAGSRTASPMLSVSAVFSSSLALAAVLVAAVMVVEEVCSRASD